MKIYISIPITGRDFATQKAKATEIAEQIRALGHEPVNPFDTPAPLVPLSEREQYAYYMGEDIKRLLMCDAIFRCEGAFESRGCLLEAHAAYYCGLESFDEIMEIPAANQRQ